MNDAGHQNDWSVPCNETSDDTQLCRHPLVSVIMYGFNHEKFIAQAIEGVVTQETDFEYELIIGEDCSQDRTREICFEYQRRYPDRIRVLWSDSNLHHIKGNSRRCRVRARGKYIAFHDGDDYWTDPKKLQKQVEYMDAHPGCAGCFHERLKCDEDGRIMEVSALPDKMKRPLTGDDIAVWTFPVPPTCTVMWRREVLLDRPEWMNKLFFGDRATAIWAGYAHGTVDWVEGVAPSVYRIHPGGVFRGLGDLQRIEAQHHFTRTILSHFPVRSDVRRAIHGAWAREIMWLRSRQGREGTADDRCRLENLHRKDRKGAPFYVWTLYRLTVSHGLGRFVAAIQSAVSGFRHRLKLALRHLYPF